MDALDAMIVRELGMEPFVAWPRRAAGWNLSEVARRLGRNLQFVKDRVGRMERDGVIKGYRLVPNLRHFGLDFTTVLWRAGFIPERDALSRLGAVDGFVGVFWSLESLLCLDLTHAGGAQRRRRLALIGDLLGLEDPPQVLSSRAAPEVGRRLTPLDWRIVAALLPDARRPLSEVAAELEVTAKTVRSRFNAMWKEGSVDTHLVLDFERMTGVIPFAVSVWSDDDAHATEQHVLRHFRDRYLGHVPSPPDGYCSFQVRVFAYTPAEVQAILREASALPGVRHVEPFLVTGAYYGENWLAELMARRVPSEPVPASGSAPSA